VVRGRGRGVCHGAPASDLSFSHGARRRQPRCRRSNGDSSSSAFHAGASSHPFGGRANAEGHPCRRGDTTRARGWGLAPSAGSACCTEQRPAPAQGVPGFAHGFWPYPAGGILPGPAQPAQGEGGESAGEERGGRGGGGYGRGGACRRCTQRSPPDAQASAAEPVERRVGGCSGDGAGQQGGVGGQAGRSGLPTIHEGSPPSSPRSASCPRSPSRPSSAPRWRLCSPSSPLTMTLNAPNPPPLGPATGRAPAALAPTALAPLQAAAAAAVAAVAVAVGAGAAERLAAERSAEPEVDGPCEPTAGGHPLPSQPSSPFSPWSSEPESPDTPKTRALLPVKSMGTGAAAMEMEMGFELEFTSPRGGLAPPVPVGLRHCGWSQRGVPR